MELSTFDMFYLVCVILSLVLNLFIGVVFLQNNKDIRINTVTFGLFLVTIALIPYVNLFISVILLIICLIAEDIV